MILLLYVIVMVGDEQEEKQNKLSRRGMVQLIGMMSIVLLSGCRSDGTAKISNSSAKDRALAAEEQYITEQLGNASCVDSWGLVSFTGLQKEATVTNRTSDGVYVVVRHPYVYSTEEVDADVESEAHYLVTSDDIDRISGTEVSPC